VKRILRLPDGETLRLPPPPAGDLVIHLDGRQRDTALCLGTQTLEPGAEMPVHRHRGHDEALFVHKGQGRATVGQEQLTVTPGAVVLAPRQTWHGLRNTGTGILQVVWVSAPPGMSELFRDLARGGLSSAPERLRQLSERYGLELASPQEPPSASASPAHEPRRRRRRRRRPAAGSAAAQKPAAIPPGQPAQPTLAEAPPSVAAPAQPAFRPEDGQPPTSQAQAPRRRRRHRTRRRHAHRQAAPPASSPSPPPAATAPRQAIGARPRSDSPATLKAARHAAERRPRRPRGKVKEVYMGGRWIRVVGEGPVIA
jgi:quercetin dioxygenase-like cupin family protein